MGDKWCWRCRDFLPRQDFNRDRSRSDGLQPICRSCNAELQRQGYRRLTDDRRRQRIKKTSARESRHRQKAHRQRLKEAQDIIAWYRGRGLDLTRIHEMTGVARTTLHDLEHGEPGRIVHQRTIQRLTDGQFKLINAKKGRHHA
jgi:site-specific DNA-cytosine methylase